MRFSTALDLSCELKKKRHEAVSILYAKEVEEHFVPRKSVPVQHLMERALAAMIHCGAFFNFYKMLSYKRDFSELS